MPVIVGREDSGENNLPPFLLVLTSCVLWECALSGSIHSCVCAALILGFIRVRGIDERMMFIIDVSRRFKWGKQRQPGRSNQGIPESPWR